MEEKSVHPWELAWKEGRWRELSPPLPALTKFADSMKILTVSRVLDLGCGAGRHAIYLAKAGFQVTGLDVSATALRELQGRLNKDNLTNVTIIRHDMLELPFIDDYFEGVVSTNVLHHGTRADIKRTIGEVYRVMRKSAVAFVVTLSKKDFRYGDGKNLEPDTFLFTEGDEKGIIHHFFSEKEVRSFFRKFECLTLDEQLSQVEKGHRAHYILKIRKA